MEMPESAALARCGVGGGAGFVRRVLLRHAALVTDAPDSLPASFEVPAHHRPVVISDGVIAGFGVIRPRRYRSGQAYTVYFWQGIVKEGASLLRICGRGPVALQDIEEFRRKTCQAFWSGQSKLYDNSLNMVQAMPEGGFSVPGGPAAPCSCQGPGGGGEALSGHPRRGGRGEPVESGPTASSPAPPLRLTRAGAATCAWWAGRNRNL